MSTRTERIFAAFQGPVLSVGTTVVHMFRSYTAELLIPRRWRLALGLSTTDVVAALQHASCTSSRRHLRSNSVVLAVEVQGVLVCSEQFSIFARKPGRQQRRKTGTADPSAISSACSPQSDLDPPQPDVSDCAMVQMGLPAHLAIIVRAYRTTEDAESGSDVCAKYRRNAIPNTVNRDIEGLWELIARIHSW
eukprot:m51a1_g12602 hypothetical protein (192) ;mRNA; f:2965-3952